MEFMRKAGLLEADNANASGVFRAVSSVLAGFQNSTATAAAEGTSPGAESGSVSPVTALMRSAKPWTEFWGARKLSVPSSANDLRRRLMTNLPHFKSNYVILFFAVSILSVVVHPISLVALLLLGALGFYLFVHLSNSDQVPPPLRDDNAKRLCFVVAACLVLWFTDAVTVVGSWGLVSMLGSIAHASLKPPLDEPDFESSVGGASV